MPAERFILVLLSLLVFALSLHAAESEYDPDVSHWQEVAVPPQTNRTDWMVWKYSNNYSKIDWRVYSNNGQPSAQLNNEPMKAPFQRPEFTPTVEGFGKRGHLSCAPVDDGWLVGFNQGEFGAALRAIASSNGLNS